MLTTDTPPDKVKVTSYMPGEMLADVDGLRADLRRRGIHVDRGRMIRGALVLAASHPDEWVELLRGEE